MLASPTALKDYLFADSEAEYLMRHNAASDISRRELSAPAGARYLRKPDENEDRPHGAVGPRAFVMPLDVDQMNLGPRFSARTRFRLPNTWTRKISCCLCCFFGGCHWLPRRMKHQERPYDRTLLHSREAGRERTKMSDQVPFRFFRSRCRFRCMLRFPKNAMHIGLTGFAESTVMRYLFCIEGASSPGDAYALSMATTLVPSLPCNPPRIGRPCRR